MQLSIRGCPSEVHRALKQSAKANRRSLSAEILTKLAERAERPLTARELAQNLRKARKVMTEKEHREFAEDIQRGIELMRRERLH